MPLKKINSTLIEKKFKQKLKIEVYCRQEANNALATSTCRRAEI